MGNSQRWWALAGLFLVIGVAALVVSSAPKIEPVQSSDTIRLEIPTESTALSVPLSPPTTEAVLIPVLGEAKALTEIDGWLQSDIDELSDLEGNVVVVQFWTFSCRNCKATLPYLQGLYEAHADEDFEIVGVHSPEFDFEKDPEAVSAAATDLGVSWPIVLDTGKRNFFAWQGSPAYWPRTYVLDRQGRIRYDHIGEGKYDELSATVALLLEET